MTMFAMRSLAGFSGWLRLALVTMLAMALAACTTTPKPIEGASADAFSRIGRFAITVNEEGGKQNAVQGGFSWSDDGQRYVLDLTNPLGSTEARVEGRPGAASLTKADGTRLQADNPDALAEEALGSSMPVSGLRSSKAAGGQTCRAMTTWARRCLCCSAKSRAAASWCAWWSTNPEHQRVAGRRLGSGLSRASALYKLTM